MNIFAKMAENGENRKITDTDCQIHDMLKLEDNESAVKFRNV